MGTMVLGCGCWITRNMFGDREIMDVGHCNEHAQLYSQDKTIRQMADEIYDLNKGV